MDNSKTTVSLKFTVDELNLLLAALGKQPAEVVLSLINRIVADAQAQLPQQAAEPEQEAA